MVAEASESGETASSWRERQAESTGTGILNCKQHMLGEPTNFFCRVSRHEEFLAVAASYYVVLVRLASVDFMATT